MPNVDEVIAVLGRYKDYQAKAEAAQHALKEAQTQAEKVLAEAEKQARTILQDAQQQVKQQVAEAVAREKGLAQKEADVASREAAVKWVDGKTQELAQQEANLASAIKEAATAKNNALAEHALWQTRQKELDEKAAVLEARVLKLTAWEDRIRQGLPVASTV